MREVLDLAGALEKGSEHPLGAAIIARAHEDELGFGQVSDFEAIAGGGVDGTVDAGDGPRAVLIGTRRWLTEQGVDGRASQAAAALAEVAGQTVA